LQDEADQQQRSSVNGVQYAVIIGVSKYQHVRPLGAAREDAVDFFDVLNDPTNRLNFASDHIALLLDDKATLRNIRAALSTWLINRVGPGWAKRLDYYLFCRPSSLRRCLRPGRQNREVFCAR